MEKTFHTIEQLRAEICLLNTRKRDQEEAIAAKFSSPAAVFSTFISLFRGHKPAGQKSFLEGFLSQDLVTSLSRIILPFFVNNVILKKSGFITRIIATFLTQKAAKNVNSGLLSDLVDKVKNLFSSKSRKRAAVSTVPGGKDYGIPPDSETY